MRQLARLVLLVLSAGVAFSRVPNAPVLTSPPNAATNQQTFPTLRWNPSPGTTNYRVQVATDSLFISIVADDSTVTTTSTLVGPLSNSMLYFWRVRGRNSNGSAPYSITWSFTTVIAPPQPPTLVSPPSSSINQPRLLTLSWDPVPTATTYRLQVSRDTPFQPNQIVFDDSIIIGTSRQVGPLGNDSTFYWRVIAKNAGGNSLPSDIWNLTTVIAAPAVPALLSPPSASLNQPASLILKWRAAARADRYHLQLAKDSPFDALVFSDSSLTDTTRFISGLDDFSTYFWRVRASNIGGTSTFSSISNFTTILPAPGLSLPANRSINQPTTLTVAWNPVANAEFYKLQVATDSLFTAPALSDSTISGTSRIVPGLQTNRIYFWRVRAKKGNTISNYSQVFPSEPLL